MMRKMRKMKKSMIAVGLGLAVLLLGFTSCEKSDDPTNKGIEGTYIGAFSSSDLLKSAPLDALNGGPGTTEVSLSGDNQIEVHCFGEEIDTTFMLGYYENNDSVMVCLLGDEFDEMYGHMLGEGHMSGSGHMSGGMMGGIDPDETEWMHHLGDEHTSHDDHFGGFHIGEGTFTYSFRMMEGSSPYYLKFHGVKE